MTLIHTAAQYSLRHERSREELGDSMQKILGESQRTTALIDDRLLLARGDAGMEAANLEVMDAGLLLREAADVSISVADTGTGISPEDLPHVFERFWRADKVRSREAGGTGLGLTIASQIAELHGARLDVQSEIGRGSIFSIRIPGPAR
jgi:signal transduction histidine kinase